MNMVAEDYLEDHYGVPEVKPHIKVPPHSLEAEQSVLGGLVLDPNAWVKVADLIAEGEFYYGTHRLIYRSIGRLIEANRPVDVVTLSEDLERLGQLETVGGLAYLADLAQNTPSAANIRRYAEIIHDRYLLRELVTATTDIQDAIFNPEGRETRQILDDAEAKVFRISEQHQKGAENFQDATKVLGQVIQRIDMLYSRDDDSDITGTATGFADLDLMTTGLQPGDLVIVAGRPSMGKTAFALNVSEKVAIEDKKPVAVFSMEMGSGQLMTRVLGSVGRIDQQRLRTGKLQDEDWEKLSYATAKISEAPLFIDETGALSAMDIRARCRRLMRDLALMGINNGQLGLVVIDYLQLMSSSATSGSENRATQLSEISRALKGLAKELEVPVVVLSQLNRSVEQRPDKRPIMSDIRESGAIEQDADLILFMFREEYYKPEDENLKGKAEAIIGKQRNGPVGRVMLTYQGQYTRFENFGSPNGYKTDY